MSEVKVEQLELDFNKGEKEMEETKVVEMVEGNAHENKEEEVRAQVVISLLANGQLDVNVPEGAPQLQAIEIEQITRQVSEQLRDIRIATTAIEIFKARLG